MRGVALINAITIVAEVGDFSRFGNPRRLMAYLGLVPSEQSTGGAVRRGRITKSGKVQARRALIEGAWTYRMQARVSRKLYDRLEALPQNIRDLAWKAQVRLCSRWRRLAAGGKPNVVVTTAIAREMAGFIWAIARQVQPRRFRYDAKHDILKCPRGRILRPARPYKHGRFFIRRRGIVLSARSEHSVL
jgi:transposase